MATKKKAAKKKLKKLRKEKKVEKLKHAKIDYYNKKFRITVSSLEELGSFSLDGLEMPEFKTENKKEKAALERNFKTGLKEKKVSEAFERLDGELYTPEELRKAMGTLTQKVKKNGAIGEQDLLNFGMTFKVVEYRMPAFSERKAKRFLFSGEVMVKPKKFSGFYRNLKKQNKSIEASPEDYKSEDNLLIKALSEHESFEGYKEDLFKQFAKAGIAPSDLSKLKENDIYDCLADVCVDRGTEKLDYRTGEPFRGKNGERGGFVFEGERPKFMKTLANEYSVALKKAFVSDGRTPEEADQTIEDMKKGQIPVGYNVHHKVPIAGSAGKNDLDNGVNSPDNFVLIKKVPCHEMIHNYMENFEGIGKYNMGVGKSEKTANHAVWANIPMPKDDVMFYAGPNKDLQVTEEQTNDRMKHLSKKLDTEKLALKMRMRKTPGR